jgi:hypothetical protein
MTGKKQLFTVKDVVTSTLMLVLLTWLTVCLPFVNESQKAVKAQTEKSSKDVKDNGSNPLTNTNEEKNEGGTSLLSEYLHEAPVLHHHFIAIASIFKGHPSNVYIAFHPEMIIPPPEI